MSSLKTQRFDPPRKKRAETRFEENWSSEPTHQIFREINSLLFSSREGTITWVNYTFHHPVKVGELPINHRLPVRVPSLNPKLEPLKQTSVWFHASRSLCLENESYVYKPHPATDVLMYMVM